MPTFSPQHLGMMSAHSQDLINKCKVNELCPPGSMKGKKVYSDAPENSSRKGPRRLQGTWEQA